jgi:hypothetical protein
MVERTPKESHLDTIYYEMAMLTFCFEKLAHSQSQDDLNLAIEGFLLHYRNLIRFFSGKDSQTDDLRTENPSVWAGRDMNPTEVKQIREAAATLDTTYFKSISKYLQHCTTLRADVPKGWDMKDLMAKLAPVMAAFKAAFPKDDGSVAVSPQD